MKSAFFKTILREIRGSFGRWMAILGIVMLGVAVFAGLSICTDAMVQTADEQLSEQSFFDFQLVSTLGFSSDDIEAISAIDGLKDVEGSIHLDALYINDGNELALRTHSLTRRINTLRLEEGRLPQKADECVADSRLFTTEAIGTQLKLSTNNDSDTLDDFSTDSYTIVGLVSSPLYINTHKESTHIGNGQLNGFIYLLPEAFTMDYFTEIYISLTAGGSLYSDDYDQAVDAMQDAVSAACDGRADIRYEKIVNDAQQEIDEGWDDYYAGRQKIADAEQELADARKKLADGQQELKDNEQKVADAQQKIADAEQEIADGEQEIADGEREIADGERELADAQEELMQAQDELDEGRKELEEGKTQLDAAQAELDAGWAQYNAGLEEYESNKAQLEQNEQSIRTALAAIEEQKRLAETDEQRAALEAQEKELNEQLVQVQYGLDALESGKTQLDSSYQQLAAAQAELDAGWEDYYDGLAELENGQAEIDDGWEQVRQSKQELADAKQELEDGRAELEEAKIELADAKTELEKGQAELKQAQADLQQGWNEYYQAKKDADKEIAEAEIELADAYQKLLDAEQELSELKTPTTYTLTRNANRGYANFDSDAGIVRGIAKVFPLFFFLIAALVCTTTMTRMVDDQSTQIGVLKALGYQQKHIAFKYMAYSGSAALIGCIIGFFGGCWLFPEVIWMAYKIMYTLKDIVYVFDLKLALISLTGAMLCSVGATWLACRAEFSRVPAELVRPKAPKSGKRVFIEHIRPLWSRLSFLNKITVRNTLRYKKRMLMMILGVGGCTALLLTGLGINDSISDIGEYQYSEISLFDAEVTCMEQLDPEQIQDIRTMLGNDLLDLRMVHSDSYDVSFQQNSHSVQTIVSQQGELDGFIDLHDAQGGLIPAPQAGEIVVCRRIAELLGVEVGDTLSLRDNNLQQLKLTVSSICENYISLYAYVDSESFTQQLGSVPEKKLLLLNLADNADINAAAGQLLGRDDIAAVTLKQDMLQMVNDMMTRMNYIVALIVICAAALIMIVLFNLTNININERLREIATIKVLGFSAQETASYIFRENNVLTVIGALFGLLGGKALHGFVMAQISIDSIYFATRISTLSYIIAFVLTFCFSLLVQLLQRRRLQRINMTESLKSVE